LNNIKDGLVPFKTQGAEFIDQLIDWRQKNAQPFRNS